MTDENKKRASPNSLIGDLRKEQILEAAASALLNDGYTAASLAKIAKQADISPALISYYFPTKTELIETLRLSLLKKQEEYVHGKVAKAQTPLEMLYIYIRACLSYTAEHRTENNALMEIIYNARAPDGTPYYKLYGSEETELLQKIIEAVQRKGGFLDTDAASLAIMINGAVRGYTMDVHAAEIKEYEKYCDELIEIVSKLSGFARKYTYEPIHQ